MNGTIILLSLAIATFALYFGNFLETNENSLSERQKYLDMTIDIENKTGEISFSLGPVQLTKGNLIIRPKITGYYGNLTIALNGAVLLTSTSNSYRINMPCLFSSSEPCYRVMMLIPGYDIPLGVEEGVYNLSIILSWKAMGTGRLYLRILIEHNGLTAVDRR